MPAAKKSHKAAPKKRMPENDKKWTKAVMDAGFTVLPSVLIERQRALGLDPVDMNILLHLANRWWTADTKPFPSVATIGAAIDRDRRTVQRRIAAMESIGLIRREARKMSNNNNLTNIYHLDGLIKELTPFAKEIVANRDEDSKEKRARAARRGRPKLKSK